MVRARAPIPPPALGHRCNRHRSSRWSRICLLHTSFHLPTTDPFPLQIMVSRFAKKNRHEKTKPLGGLNRFLPVRRSRQKYKQSSRYPRGGNPPSRYDRSVVFCQPDLLLVTPATAWSRAALRPIVKQSPENGGSHLVVQLAYCTCACVWRGFYTH